MSGGTSLRVAAVVTALLSNATDGVSVDVTGTLLVTAGTAIVAYLVLQAPRRRAGTA